MPFTPPPPPLPERVVRERIAAGAKTLAEIDPLLALWVRENERDRLWRLVPLLVMLGFLLGLVIGRMLP